LERRPREATFLGLRLRQDYPILTVVFFVEIFLEGNNNKGDCHQFPTIIIIIIIIIISSLKSLCS
jgi:hypothetical protein